MVRQICQATGEFQRKAIKMTNIPSISDFGISARGYAEFFDGIPAAIYRTTLEGKIVYCNKAFANIFGFASADELIDSPVIDLYRNKKDRGVFIHSLLQRGRLSDLPIAFQMKDGTPIMCAVSAKAVLDDDEMVVHLDGYLREITGQIEVSEDVLQMDGRADDLKHAVIVIDLHGGLIDINQAGAQLMGFSRAEMLGQPVSGFFAPEDREFFLIFLADIIKIGRNETILAVTDRGAKKRHLDWHAYLVRNDSQPHHIKCIARDVSDIVNRQKERSNDEKFQGVLEMAGGVAHSLNQPLTIVNNLLNEILSELDRDGSIFPKVQKVYDQMKKMNEIAQKIGNIKKYEAMDYVAGVKIVDIDKASWAQTVKDIS
jgi:PAS domain S-box-containing protein